MCACVCATYILCVCVLCGIISPTPCLLLSCPCVKVAASSAGPKKLGAFTLHDDTPAANTGSLLFKRDSSKADGASLPPSSSAVVSVAAHARMASAAALKKKEEREKGQDHVVGSGSGGGSGTGSSGVKRKEETTTVSSSALASKPAGAGVKRQVSKTAISAADKGKQKKTSEILH